MYSCRNINKLVLQLSNESSMRTSNIDTSNGYVINIKHAIQPPKVQAVQTEKQNIKTQNHTIINQIIKPKTT